VRTLGEIMHPQCKISLFSWNGKYLVKFEQGLCEQTFKFEHLEITAENPEAYLRESVVGALLPTVLNRFAEMHECRITALG
jgi:hypothetical protein